LGIFTCLVCRKIFLPRNSVPRKISTVKVCRGSKKFEKHCAKVWRTITYWIIQNLELWNLWKINWTTKMDSIELQHALQCFNPVKKSSIIPKSPIATREQIHIILSKSLKQRKTIFYCCRMSGNNLKIYQYFFLFTLIDINISINR